MIQPQAVLIEVGHPFPELVSRDFEGTQIGIDELGLSLRVFMPSPTPMEIADIQAVPLEARIMVTRHSLFFYFRMGGNRWKAEGYFSPWRAKKSGYGLYPAPTPGYGAPLHIVLVDSTTGIVKGMRLVVVSRAFSTAVLTSCNEILRRPADDEAHVAEIATQSRIPMEVAAERATIRFSTATRN